MSEAPSRLFRYRLHEISRPKPVPRGQGWLYLQLDLHALRRMGIDATPEPHAWRILHRVNAQDDCIVINCIAYALGLHASRVYIGGLRAAIKKGTPAQGFMPEIAEALLDSRRNLWRRKPTPMPWDLVVYCDGPQRRIKHLGVMLPNGRVRSKWGSLPAICEHRLWDVPSVYGDSVQFYCPVPLATTEAFYRGVIT